MTYAAISEAKALFFRHLVFCAAVFGLGACAATQIDTNHSAASASQASDAAASAFFSNTQPDYTPFQWSYLSGRRLFFIPVDGSFVAATPTSDEVLESFPPRLRVRVLATGAQRTVAINEMRPPHDFTQTNYILALSQGGETLTANRFRFKDTYFQAKIDGPDRLLKGFAQAEGDEIVIDGFSQIRFIPKSEDK